MKTGRVDLAGSTRRVEHAVAQALTETADPSQTYASVLAAIGDSLGCRLGAAWEEAPDRRVLRCVELWEAPGADTGRFRALTERLTLGLGEGLPGRVWTSGEPAWIADLHVDENFPRGEAAAAADLRAAFCFPVTVEGRVVGALEFFAAEHREPDDVLLASVAVLGSQIGQLVARRHAEAAAHAGEALNRAILDSALDAVVTMDSSGRVLEFNPAAERTFGHRREDVIGRDMADLSPSLRDRHRRGFARYLETGHAVLLDERVEITGMRADGSEFPVELTITRIGVAGRPTFTGFLRDITERKEAEAALRASRARLVEAADSERRRIERNLHDGAQQRLVALALRLRLLSAGLPESAADTRAALDALGGEAATALEELREIARGIHPAVLAERGLVSAVRALCERAAVQVEVAELPSSRLPDSVEAAAYYVVAEALTNAAKHAAADSVLVRLSARDGVLEVIVADDGAGGASLAGGTGLRGLADRVEAAGGSLEVHSPPGDGTRLRAEIPLA